MVLKGFTSKFEKILPPRTSPICGLRFFAYAADGIIPVKLFWRPFHGHIMAESSRSPQRSYMPSFLQRRAHKAGKDGKKPRVSRASEKKEVIDVVSRFIFCGNNFEKKKNLWDMHDKCFGFFLEQQICVRYLS